MKRDLFSSYLSLFYHACLVLQTSSTVTSIAPIYKTSSWRTSLPTQASDLLSVLVQILLLLPRAMVHKWSLIKLHININTATRAWLTGHWQDKPARTAVVEMMESPSHPDAHTERGNIDHKCRISICWELQCRYWPLWWLRRAENIDHKCRVNICWGLQCILLTTLTTILSREYWSLL